MKITIHEINLGACHGLRRTISLIRIAGLVASLGRPGAIGGPCSYWTVAHRTYLLDFDLLPFA